MRNKILLPFSFLLILTCCSTTKKVDISDLPGIYYRREYESRNSNVIPGIKQIILFEDSTFTYFGLEGKQRTKTSGIWHFNNNRIILRSEPTPRSLIKSVDDSLNYFKEKALYFYQNKLYDREIKKGKGVRRNYYQKLERDNKPVGNRVDGPAPEVSGTGSTSHDFSRISSGPSTSGGYRSSR